VSFHDSGKPSGMFAHVVDYFKQEMYIDEIGTGSQFDYISIPRSGLLTGMSSSSISVSKLLWYAGMVLNLNEIRGNAKRVRKGRREPSSSMSFFIKAVQA
jgi:hypothetical protein